MSADPAVYDGMTIWRGLTYSRVFTCKNADGTAVDLTGWAGEFKAKASLDDDEAVIDLTGAPGIVMGGIAGTIAVTVSAEATADITDAELVYSLKLSSDSEVAGLLVGVIKVDERAI